MPAITLNCLGPIHMKLMWRIKTNEQTYNVEYDGDGNDSDKKKVLFE